MDSVPLKEHIESRLGALEKATSLAANNMERRLESMNEFRQQLREQAATFVSKTEYDSKHQLLIDKISDLRESRAELAGKASQKSVVITLIVAILSILISLISIIQKFL